MTNNLCSHIYVVIRRSKGTNCLSLCNAESYSHLHHRSSNRIRRVLISAFFGCFLCQSLFCSSSFRHNLRSRFTLVSRSLRLLLRQPRSSQRLNKLLRFSIRCFASSCLPIFLPSANAVAARSIFCFCSLTMFSSKLPSMINLTISTSRVWPSR